MGLRIGLIPVTPLQQNCTLLWNDETRDAVMVDPGGDVPRLMAALEKSGAKLSTIYLTHGHFDHAGGATELSERTGAPIIGPHKAEQFLLDDMEDSAKRFGLIARNCTPSRYLADGDTVDMAGQKFEVRHCPGHTPGHVVFLDLDGGFGIMGDVLFKGSIGRTDFGDYGNYEQLMTAIRDKLLPLPDDFTFTCGHGPTSTIGHERRTNPFLAEIAAE
jgi:glyoxylase-like metal-dependent hydrolase (beta-lactamase superfamily II)